ENTEKTEDQSTDETLASLYRSGVFPGRLNSIAVSTPKALHLKARGRAAHPGEPGPCHQPLPRRGYIPGQAGVMQPLRGMAVGRVISPGCAARPRAGGCNAFGVRNQ